MRRPVLKPLRVWIGRWRVGVLASALIAFGLTAALLYGPSRVEPSFGGKSLTFWLDEYDKEFRLSREAPAGATRDAIRMIGTNAIPALLRSIQAQDPFAARWALQRWTGGPAHPADAPKARAQRLGICGFAALGTVANGAEPDLVGLLNHGGPEVRRNAAFSLGYIGATNAIAPLLKHVNGAENEVSEAAIWALGNLRCAPGLVVPALTQVLNSGNPPLEVFEALEKFGARAAFAIPSLVALAKTHKAESFFAIQALEKIAPDQAALLEQEAVSGEHGGESPPN